MSTTSLAVLDPDPEVPELIRRVGEGMCCEVVAARGEAPPAAADVDAELFVVSFEAFASADARRAFLERSEPDSVLLVVSGDREVAELSTFERAHLGGLAFKPLGPATIAAHLDGMRRRRSEQLRRDATLRALPDIVFRMSRDGRYLDCHPRSTAPFLNAPDDFIGRRCRDIIPEELAAETERKIEETLETKMPQSFRYAIPLPDGDRGHFEARLAVSGPDEIVAVIRDVTDVIRAEEQFAHAAEMKQALASRMLELQEAERHHLARELHDAIGQMILVHKLDAEWMRARASSAEVRETAGALARGLEETLEMVRSLARGLRPPALDDFGVVPAIEMLADDMTRRSPCEVALAADISSDDVPPKTAITLYRIAQEALTNAIKHAACQRIEISLARQGDEEVVLRIDDDGVGMRSQVKRSRESLGLLGMHERAALQGGRVSVTTRAAGGTSVVAVLPACLPEPAKTELANVEGL